MFRFFSLIHRLAIFFTMVAAAMVLGLGMLFLVPTERHFLELDRITLQDKQHLIENILIRRGLFMRPHRRHACHQSTS